VCYLLNALTQYDTRLHTLLVGDDYYRTALRYQAQLTAAQEAAAAHRTEHEAHTAAAATAHATTLAALQVRVYTACTYEHYTLILCLNKFSVCTTFRHFRESDLA
jgi:hypothetical protein